MNLMKIIDGMEAMANSNIKAVDGDYLGEDGLLYCGKCHTKKQCRVEILGIVKTPMCVCFCEAERIKREDEERKRIEFERKVKDLRKMGFPDSDMQNWSFANDDLSNERITRALKNYSDNFEELRKEGKGLLLYGNCGTGKTFAACEVANALIDRGYPVLVTNFARILNTLQGSFEKQDYIDSLNRFQLLVIDDLGIERDTAFAKEQVYNIIDSRYRALLPVIITTNLSIEKIKSPDDMENSRIYDRVLERCFPIEITGGSRRRKAVREDYEAMKNLLGL